MITQKNIKQMSIRTLRQERLFRIERILRDLHASRLLKIELEKRGYIL